MLSGKMMRGSACLIGLMLMVFGCETGSKIKSEGNEPSATTGSAPPAASSTEAPAQTVYLKNNIHVQKQISRNGDEVLRASYANHTDPGAGHLIIPVNTPVSVDTRRGFRGEEILITTPDGKTIHFEYNAGRMAMNSEAYMNLITSPAPVSLKGLSAADRKGIEEGEASVGMSKEGVRMALGYPAAHKTPSLESNSWTYWKNRYATLVVEFGKDGKVKAVK